MRQPRTDLDSPPLTWRQRGRSAAFTTAVKGLSWLSQKHPALSLAHNGIRCIKDIPYKTTGSAAHTLDVYQPADYQPGDPSRPIVFYVHGGAFQMLSKDTHWFAGSLFARRGYIVFNINYRLAPVHRYPAAIQDAADALLWVLEHAHEYGGDIDEIVLTGESAGGNIAAALTAAAHYDLTEPFAQRIREAAPKIKASIPACGVLQVSDMQRFGRRRHLPDWLKVRLLDVHAYLPNEEAAPGVYPLADPLLIYETATPIRPLPPFFTFVGTKDPLLDDTRRLKAALDRCGASCEYRVYPGGIHAFHALLWQRQARECWRHTFAFLDGLEWKTPRDTNLRQST